ncbi:hypothetical protein RvY_13587-1 [Ramazzottius varieornatus]|uniref:Uncharacterized protein n=1 Tax=Ramazzottius varieornatus TaxID=947166 RepID=A0A1D1VND4_RAMVA|nr:hypothetical protein RvY_13587-1 [Ramazzottius varieornatus]
MWEDQWPVQTTDADVVQEHPWLLVETDHQHQKMSITLLLDDTPRHVPVAAQSYRPNPAFEDRRDSGFGDEDGDRQSDMSTSPSDDDGFAQNGLPESDWGMFAASSQWKAIVNRIAAAEELRLALGESFAEHDIVASTSGLTAFTGLVDVPTAVFTESAGSVELCNTTSLAHTGQQVSETATFGLDLTPPKGAPSVNIGVTGEADKVVERAVKKKKSNFRKCLSFMRRTFMGSCKGYRLG